MDNKTLGTSLQLGSLLFVPGMGEAAGTTLGARYLIPIFGRTVGKAIGRGIATGGITGFVEGLGRGLANDDNPFKTALEDSTIGLFSGGVLGYKGANIGRVINGKKLKPLSDVDSLNEIQRTLYNKEVKNFYKNYLQDITLNKDGKVKFTGKGIQEILRWNPKQGQNLPELIKDFKKAKKLEPEVNTKINEKPFVTHYDVYGGKLGNYLVENLKDGTRRFYFTRDIPNGTPHTTNMGSIRDNNNIITDLARNFKTKLFDYLIKK